MISRFCLTLWFKKLFKWWVSSHIKQHQGHSSNCALSQCFRGGHTGWPGTAFFSLPSSAEWPWLEHRPVARCKCESRCALCEMTRNSEILNVSSLAAAKHRALGNDWSQVQMGYKVRWDSRAVAGALAPSPLHPACLQEGCSGSCTPGGSKATELCAVDALSICTPTS